MAPLLAAVSDDEAQQVSLIIHNGDLLPSRLLAEHAHRFSQVSAVNWLGDRTVVEPLPIGLENAWIGVNGEWALFHDCVPSQRTNLLARPRARAVLIAFNDKTCPEVRGAARDAFTSSVLDVDAPSFMTPVDYHARLRDSMFVPSPRGNGADCHRTWEAIYAGAVPIVLRSDWAFDHLGLPVLVVEAWEEAVQLLENGAADVYADYASRSAAEAYGHQLLRRVAGD